MAAFMVLSVTLHILLVPNIFWSETYGVHGLGHGLRQKNWHIPYAQQVGSSWIYWSSLVSKELWTGCVPGTWLQMEKVQKYSDSYRLQTKQPDPCAVKGPVLNNQLCFRKQEPTTPHTLQMPQIHESVGSLSSHWMSCLNCFACSFSGPNAPKMNLGISHGESWRYPRWLLIFVHLNHQLKGQHPVHWVQMEGTARGW